MREIGLVARMRDGYVGDESGAITPLMLVFFVGLLLITGFSLDLVKHEGERAELQDALDRGVLAAASLSQTLNEEETRALVLEYVGLRNLSTDTPVLNVTPTLSLNSREVTATANYGMRTTILSIAGLDALAVVAGSTAIESRRKTEISLVIDISGTMRWAAGNSTPANPADSRIEVLRPVARNFIDNVIGDTTGLVSVNLIPYAGAVNPGAIGYRLIGGRFQMIDDNGTPEIADDEILPAYVFNDFGTPTTSDDLILTGVNTCPVLTAADFTNAATRSKLPAAGAYNPVLHFHNWNIEYPQMEWGWCPSNRSRIRYHEGDKDALKAAIDDLRLHDGTGTYNATKWGVALLDPASQPFISQLRAAGVVAEAFSDRPAPWDDKDTLKVLVVMTDGKITEQRSPTIPNVNPRRANGNSVCTDPRNSSTITAAECQELLDDWVEDLEETEILRSGSDWLTSSDTLSAGNGRTYFQNLCNDARANGITVYTLAVQAPAGAQTEMANCAAVAGNFFIAGLDDIDDVFETIAAEINNLKLTN